MSIFNLLELIEFRQPLWLLVTLVPLVLFALNYLLTASMLPQASFEKEMSSWYLNNNQSFLSNKTHLIIVDFLFWLSLSVAIAGPEYPEVNTDIVNNKGDVYMLVVDVSASMNSRDEHPSRLLRARSEMILLADSLKSSDRLGVLLFAGSTHLLFPPTSDKNAMHFFIKQIRANILPLAGSDIVTALKSTESVLSESKDAVSKFVILMSDGDIENESKALTQIEQLDFEFAVNTIAIGQTQNTPVPSFSGNEQWLRHDDGRIVLSNRNDSFLRNLADITRGNFKIANNTDTKFEFLTTSKPSNNSYAENTRSNTNWIQLYHSFLCVAVILFFYRRILVGRQR